MKLVGRARVVLVAAVLALAVWVLDSVLDLGPDGLLALRVLAVLAAAVAAATAFQVWSTADERTPPVHAAAASALLGGAALASAATSAPDGEALGSAVLTALGLAGLVVAAVALRLETTVRTRP